MKIIIAGCGRIGEGLTRALTDEGHDLTLIDTRASVLATVPEKYDVMAIRGNCAAMPVLRDAGVGDAQLLIACTGSDEVNLLCCLTAHMINPALHTIARIRDPEYNEQAYTMRDAFALSMTFNPEEDAALEIKRLLLYPGFFQRDSFAKGKVEIVELRVEEGSRLEDLPLSALNATVKCRVLVCAVLRDGESITPGGSFVLRRGDRLFITAPAQNLSALLKNLGYVTERAKRVMIAGGGNIGYYLARKLDEMHMKVQIIENDPDRCLELADLLPHATVILGDAGDHSLLESDGLENSDALICCTGMDEMNLLTALYASSRGIRQVMTKLGRLEHSALARSLTPGSIISPVELCSANIVRYVRALENQSGAAITVHSIADGKAEAVEFLVEPDTPHIGEPLKKFHLRPNILIASITRGEETVIPGGDSSFRAGDSIVVVVGGDAHASRLHDIFQ